MSGRSRICVFCSIEKRYVRFFRTVRKRHPDAYVVALMRHGLVLTEDERELVDEVRELDAVSSSAGRPTGLMRLLRTLREERYDVLIVLFDSLKLRVLSAFSGAAHCTVWKEDGRLVIIPASFLRSMSQVARLRAIGYWKLSRVWLSSRLLRVRPRV